MGGDPWATQVRLVLAPAGTVSPSAPALMVGLVAGTGRQSRGTWVVLTPAVMGAGFPLSVAAHALALSPFPEGAEVASPLHCIA